MFRKTKDKIIRKLEKQEYRDVLLSKDEDAIKNKFTTLELHIILHYLNKMKENSSPDEKIENI